MMKSKTQLQMTGSGAIVDWILVELRSSTDSGSIVQTIPGLLARDGTIMGADSGPLTVAGVPDGQYYVVIRHRNHLPVMAAAPVTLLTTGTTTLDFTNESTASYGTSGQRLITTGVYAMRAGDANHDGVVDSVDRDNYRTPQNG